MGKIKNLGLVFLTFLLLFPGSLKLTHIFLGHNHVYCDHYSESHYHQENTDCELFSFQQLSFPYVEIMYFEGATVLVEKTLPHFHYDFLSIHQHSGLPLRAPPLSV